MRENATIITQQNPASRITTGVSYLKKALKQIGFTPDVTAFAGTGNHRDIQGLKIYVGNREDDSFISYMEQEELLLYHSNPPQDEGFYLARCAGNLIVVSGGSDTGALYGCLELCEIIEREGEVPATLAFGDAPKFVLRGPAIGLQKTKVEPPRLTYEYPITPERFPWFYDKPMWEEFLEMMTWQRCNVLYLWTGHPFSSLITLEDYPEALEVTQDQLKQNREIFTWLTQECERRGIWVVLKFYSIHVPLPFAQKHGIDLLQSSITALNSDYTAKSIVAFIKEFPHIGLMVCLGEALRGNANKTEWFVETILPAVRKGVKEAGILEEPPVILRGHDCDPYDAMTKGKKEYQNIYTMWKYNGESLTTHVPRGKWQSIHRSLNGLAKAHIMNVHVLANLEPFRYQAPAFIQKCVQAGRDRLGCNGLHLYPLFFWDWPYSPDKTTPRLFQLKRDWLWYAAWFRYAWNPDLAPQTEKLYWQQSLSQVYGCSLKSAELLLKATESSAQVFPRLCGRIGITEGNRQTFTLGMTMSQLTNAKRYRPNPELFNSVAVRGEHPEEFVSRELDGLTHMGETPQDLIDDVYLLAKNAMDYFKTIPTQEISAGQQQEFLRIGQDIEAIFLITQFYCAKITAAMYILQYKKSMDENMHGDISLLQSALPHMEQSLEFYRNAAELTDATYLYANSMQTRQRKIPFPDGDAFGHWRQCLPVYEEELANYKLNLECIKQGNFPSMGNNAEEASALPQVNFEILSPKLQAYQLNKGESIFTECDFKIKEVAGELKGLTGIRFSLKDAIEEGIHLELDLKEDCKILVGYLQAKGVEWLQLPELETNTHADDRGGLTPAYFNAAQIDGAPPVNIHAYNYEKGRHSIYFGTGAFIIAGVVPSDTVINARDAGLSGEPLDSLDWLFESF